MSDVTEREEFHPEHAPMAFDRSAGWAYFRNAGEVVQGEGAWFLTSADAVQYAHHHPELFSSARAFDFLGSPLPMIPLASDPPAHVRYRRGVCPSVGPRALTVTEDEHLPPCGGGGPAFAAAAQRRSCTAQLAL